MATQAQIERYVDALIAVPITPAELAETMVRAKLSLDLQVLQSQLAEVERRRIEQNGMFDTKRVDILEAIQAKQDEIDVLANG